ncbi:MAG: BT_3928 family protein [Bacteroidota bacterium]
MKKFYAPFCRYLVAAVFIFSGFVKCVDPTGTAYKMEDYFTAFGTDFMIPFSMFLSICMCGIELLVGLMILCNLRITWGAWGALALMAFYTPLTLWLAITDKVTDCGCFGDAITLSNWQTFIKNILLDVFVVYLFIVKKKFKKAYKPKVQTAGVLTFAVFVFAFEFYNLAFLPMIDFMPYKVGNNIPAGMIIPDNAPRPKFRNIFYYEKDGRTRKFTADNLPDSTWTFVDRKDLTIRKGFEPPIHDFVITNTDNVDFTNSILEDPGYTYLLVISSFKNTNKKSFEKVNRIAESAISQGYGFYALTSSLPEEYELFKEQVKASYPIYMMDETTLKTMIRSNPGLILIKKGTVVGKWHFRQLGRVPDVPEK